MCATVLVCSYEDEIFPCQNIPLLVNKYWRIPPFIKTYPPEGWDVVEPRNEPRLHRSHRDEDQTSMGSNTV